MKNLINNKISLLIALTILLIIAAGVFFYLYPATPNNNTNNQSGDIVTTKIEGSKTLNGFPENLPIDSGSIIVQNYESTGKEGRTQSTKQFTTKLSIADATAKYVAFFEADGWRVRGDAVSPVTLTRQGNILSIEVSKYKQEGVNSVKLTVIQNKK